MASICHRLTAGLSLLLLAVSIAILWAGISLHNRPESPCWQAVQTPLIGSSAALLVVSLLGLLGSCCRLTILLLLFMMILSITGLAADLSALYIGVLAADKFPDMVVAAVETDKAWGIIKSCMVELNFCGGQSFYSMIFPQIQKDYCRPPEDCRKYYNYDADCKRWSNMGQELCLDCESCKVSIEDEILGHWKTVWNIGLFILLLLSLFMIVSFCAVRKDGRHKYAHNKKYLPTAENP